METMGVIRTCYCARPAQLLLRNVENADSKPWESQSVDTSEPIVPISQTLYTRLRTLLTQMCVQDAPDLLHSSGSSAVSDPCSHALSILVLHIVQLPAPAPISARRDAEFVQRRHLHAPVELLQQVMVYVLRVLRMDDRMLLCEESGAVLVFPDVDQPGIQRIAERIFSSISLLQGETLVPPLTRETRIVLGYGYYPLKGKERAACLTDPTDAAWLSLHHQLGNAAYQLILRPALYAQPYIALPATLPERLKSLLPCSLARKLRCVPLGREHHSMTVALLDPTNDSIIDQLRQITGCTIYPVLCIEEELNHLLNAGW